MSNTSAEITRWLKAWGRGEDAALDRLTPLVYDELRRRARAYIRHETPGHTLQPTALVNEAFLHLVDAGDVDWHDRAHFFAVAARIMRRILVDAARARGTLKRGGGAERAAHFPAGRSRRPAGSRVRPGRTSCARWTMRWKRWRRWTPGGLRSSTCVTSVG